MIDSPLNFNAMSFSTISFGNIIILVLFLTPAKAVSQYMDAANDTIEYQLPVSQYPSYSYDSFLIIDDTELFVNFPRGEKAMLKFLKDSLSYPPDAMKNGIEGVVYARFCIDTIGKISNIRIVKGSNPYLDGEVIRIISIMPDWVWDKRIEMKRRRLTERTLPVSFILEKSETRAKR